MSQHVSVDGYPVEVGKRFWDNDLKVVEITVVATNSNPYSDTGWTQTWHKHTGGISDTLSGYGAKWGRLARYFEGRDAEQHEPGTKFSDIK